MAPTFNAIGIVVTEMARSLAFYRMLGLAIPASDDAEGHVEWEGPGGLRIMFDSTSVVHSYDPDWQPPVGGPAMSLAFDCGTPEEVDQLAAEIAQAGFTVHREPWDAFWGQRYATVLDPDGNRIDLFAWT